MSWKRTVWFRLSVGSIAIILVANAVLSLVILLSISNMLADEGQLTSTDAIVPFGTTAAVRLENCPRTI